MLRISCGLLSLRAIRGTDNRRQDIYPVNTDSQQNASGAPTIPKPLFFCKAVCALAAVIEHGNIAVKFVFEP